MDALDVINVEQMRVLWVKIVQVQDARLKVVTDHGVDRVRRPSPCSTELEKEVGQEADGEEGCAESAILVLAALASDDVQLVFVLRPILDILDLNVSFLLSFPLAQLFIPLSSFL